jgi:hypothetical protein
MTDEYTSCIYFYSLTFCCRASLFEIRSTHIECRKYAYKRQLHITFHYHYPLIYLKTHFTQNATHCYHRYFAMLDCYCG